MGVKIPVDSFSGIPLRFCWCLRINSFWFPLGSLLEFSCGHLGTNSVWRPLGSPLEFVIPRDSFSGIPPCFPPLGFNLIVRSRGTTFSPVRVSYSYPFLGNSICLSNVHHLYQFPNCLVALALAMPLEASRLTLAMISSRKRS